jgi:hypothetical protein
MDGLMDSLIVGTTIICSFGTAFLVQKATLGLILMAMETVGQVPDLPGAAGADPDNAGS